jgi:hypothetical protein
MKIVTHIKPVAFFGKTKKDTVQLITHGCSFTIFKHGSCYASGFSTPKTVKVFNLEKRRKKVTRHPPANGRPNSTVISQNHWVGYAYEIPVELLKLSGLKAIQTERTFFLVKVKK